MTDRFFDQPEPQAHPQTQDRGGDNGRALSQQNQEKVVVYSAQDLANAKQMADMATQMLGKLDIDGRPGVCRDEILKAAGNKHLSTVQSKTLDGLANIEPNVQTAWQVPNHRAHLKALYLTDFGKKDSPEMKKQFAQATKDLAADRVQQTNIYFGEGAVTAAKLTELKTQIGRVEMAMGVAKNPGHEAALLLKKFDKDGKGLSIDDVNVALKSNGLSVKERALLTAASAAQNAARENLEPFGNEPQPTHQMFLDATTLKSQSLTEVVKGWAVSETRADKHNKEGLFFAAIEGYNGHGIGIKSRERFNSEMDAKDGSQFAALSRRPYE